MKPKLKLFLAI